MLTVNNLVGFGAAWPKIALTSIQALSSTANTATYDFGNVTVPEDGLLIVAAGARDSANFSSISIGGVTATTVVSDGDSTNLPIGIAARRVSAGSVNVTAVFSSSCERAAGHVWLLTNNYNDTPHDTGSNTVNSNGSSVAMTMDLPGGGVAVYFHIHVNSSSGVTWSSASELTDSGLESFIRYSAAQATDLTQETSHSETASWTGSYERSIIGASWR